MSLFVTGTDTDVGKTVVSTVLALHLGWRYWKPVQCGVEPSSDTEWVRARLGPDAIDPEIYRLERPLSPHAAAALEGVTIDMDRLRAARPQRPTIIEGAGGLLVPLHAGAKMVDLIQALDVKPIVVSRSTLGTINHTLLTLEALRARRVEPLGVILVGPFNPGNAQAIRDFGQTSILGEIPRLESLSRADLIAAGQYLRKDVLWT